MSAKKKLYLKMNRSVQVSEKTVFLKDVASVLCEDASIEARAKSLKIHTFSQEGKKKIVISILELMERIGKEISEAEPVSLGETDVVVEFAAHKTKKGFPMFAKVLFVCLLCFFGASFSIMSFHNDVGVIRIFDQLYFMVMGEENNGITVLEVAYSIGLFAGIVIFYNHLGRKKLTGDLTPIEVEMKVYEEEMDKAVIETESRAGREKEKT